MKEAIHEYYKTHMEFYESWSGSQLGGYHFGFPKKPWEIFSNRTMIQNLTNLVIDQLDLRDDEKILDAGCGAGHVSLQIDKRYSSKKLEIAGITLSKEQYSLAKEKINVSNSRLKVFQGDFESTPFLENSFDVVFFIDALCYGSGSDKAKALKEISRILKPGGRLVVCDVFLKKNPVQSSRYFNALNNRVNRAWAVDDWAVENEFLLQAQHNGMQKVKDVDLTRKIPSSVLYALFKWLPLLLVKSIYSPSQRPVLQTVLQIAIFGPMLGIHPNFRYKLVTFHKAAVR